MKAYRITITLAHPDLEEFFENASARVRSKFLEMAVINYAITDGNLLVEKTLGRKALQNFRPTAKTTDTDRKKKKQATPPKGAQDAKSGKQKHSQQKSQLPDNVSVPDNIWNFIGLPPSTN